MKKAPLENGAFLCAFFGYAILTKKEKAL